MLCHFDTQGETRPESFVLSVQHTCFLVTSSSLQGLIFVCAVKQIEKKRQIKENNTLLCMTKTNFFFPPSLSALSTPYSQCYVFFFFFFLRQNNPSVLVGLCRALFLYG
jgi:hypothetical protein